MAEIIFTITRRVGNSAQGTLRWQNKGLSCFAVSGPYGQGALPVGFYNAPRNKMLDKKSSEVGFCDLNGKCWIQPIYPQQVNGREELGIHPDGNKPGTQGCIGLQLMNTEDWYSAFHSVAKHTSTTLEVIEQIAQTEK